jgi:hypothetical protein
VVWAIVIAQGRIGADIFWEEPKCKLSLQLAAPLGTIFHSKCKLSLHLESWGYRGREVVFEGLG